MKSFYVLALLMLFSTDSTAAVYKWIDAKGVVHYADTPVSGAVRVPLNRVNAATVDKDNSPATASQKNETAAPAIPKKPYVKLVITKPTNNFTYVNNEQGVIDVQLELDPALQAEDKFEAFIDGQQVNADQTNMTLTITGIDRGEHALEVRVLDGNGIVLVASNKVIFYMQRPLLRT